LLSWIRRRLGISGYWSLAGYAKRKVKSAVGFIYGFEQSVARYVKERGVDGVICGHIHAATIKEIDGITYINCGDWVDSCTAILEAMDGRMELVEWGVVPPKVEVEHAGAPKSRPAAGKAVPAPAVARELE
jgi:UDP-2,3-diacylglucosamine pyrophosphatase LpxH